MKPLRRILLILAAMVLGTLFFPTTILFSPIEWIFTGNHNATYKFFDFLDRIVNKIDPDK